MKRTLAILTWALTLLAMAGCATDRPPVDDAPVSVPTDVGQLPAPADEPAAAALPALPLWPQPGVRLLNGELDWSPSYAYAPFEIDGQVFQGIATPEGVYYVRQQGKDIFLVGGTSERGGFIQYDEPRRLYHLPVKPGDRWDLPDGSTHIVTNVEPVQTPAGEQLAARIEVQDTSRDKPDVQWWVPGYGLVKLDPSNRATWTAVTETKGGPLQAPVLGQPAPGTYALLRDDGERWVVTDLASGQELFQVEDSYWRSWYGWYSVGEFDLLIHAHFPGSWAVYGYDAHQLDEQSGQFKRVTFVDATGVEVSTGGRGSWTQAGVFELDDFTRYPSRHYLFRWDGSVMRSDPQAERARWAESGEHLVRRLLTPPPLDRESFANAFLNPDDGRRFYDLQQSEAWAYAGGADFEPDPAAPDRFLVRTGFGKDGPVRAALTVIQQDARYYIASYEWFDE